MTLLAKVHAALRQSNERFRAFLDHAPSLAFVKGTDGRYLYANRKFEEVFYPPSGSPLGKTDAELFPRDQADQFQSHDREVLESGQAIEFEEASSHADGLHTSIVVKFPLRDAVGRIYAIGGIATDITGRKQAEQMLQQSESRFRSTLDNLLEGCLIIGLDWRYLYVNSAAARQSRRSIQDLLGRTIMEAFPGFEQTMLFSRLRRCIDERMSITMENEFVFPDGSAGIFELRIQPVPEGLFILSNDISDRKRAERELAERARLSMFATEVSSFLNREEPSSRLLQRFAEAIVSQTGVAFARIWIMGSGDLCKDCYKANLCKDRTQCLHLHSSAGLSTNLNGEYRRIPLGALKIGQIAQGAGCMTTNDILQDERLPNKEWMRENGLRSFAGYPLVVEGRVYGVLAVFGREPLSTVALQTLESVCHGLATAIARKQAEETLHHNERELRRQQTQLQDLASKLIATQERERQRIASDLHDDVSQRLAALVLDIAALEQQPPLYPERIADALLPLREQLEGLSDDIHNLAYRLHPTLLEHAGLQPAVEDHIHQVTQRTGLRIILDTGDLSGWLSLDQATGLFRVLQESLQNIVKHANATDVMVRLSGSPKGFGLSVTDNGRGFDATDNNTHQKGLGLISMQERLRLLNGFLRINSRPAEGTKVCAWIPAKAGET